MNTPIFQNKKISRIKNINFILTIDTERGKWLKKAKIIFYSVFFASWTIACVLNIIYQDENMWKIIDGSKSKSSTNGTWAFGTHSFEIRDQMTVEILTTKVKFTLLQNDR